MNGMTPADAYIKTTSSFLRGNNIPAVKNFTNLSSITLNEPTDLEKKNPSLYIVNRTKELTKLYKNGSIDINTFSNDLSAIDSIDELIKLRDDLGEDPFGFETKDKDNELKKIPKRE